MSCHIHVTTQSCIEIVTDDTSIALHARLSGIGGVMCNCYMYGGCAPNSMNSIKAFHVTYLVPYVLKGSHTVCASLDAAAHQTSVLC